MRNLRPAGRLLPVVVNSNRSTRGLGTPCGYLKTESSFDNMHQSLNAWLWLPDLVATLTLDAITARSLIIVALLVADLTSPTTWMRLKKKGGPNVLRIFTKPPGALW
jgi:hypothetical protein